MSRALTSGRDMPGMPQDDGYPPKHPDADKITMSKWDVPGECSCGAVLPPMKEWEDAGRDWQHVTCSGCGRAYVDEDEFIAIYDEGLDRD